MVEEVCGARSRLAHAHVERAVVRNETPIGLVELHRGNADVERDAVDRKQPRSASTRPSG
jgi:hypothetical protein